MKAPPTGPLSFTAPDDDTVWVYTAGIGVWSTGDDRYLFDEDFREIYPDAPSPWPGPS